MRRPGSYYGHSDTGTALVTYVLCVFSYRTGTESLGATRCSSGHLYLGPGQHTAKARYREPIEHC